MKTLKVIMTMVLGLVVASCNDDADRTTKLSSEEQAELVASSMGQSGFAAAGEETADQASEASASSRAAQCGYTSDGSVSLSGTIGSIVYSYMFSYDVQMNCNASQEPENFESDFTYEGSIESSRLETQFAGDGSLTVTRLGDAEANFELDGSYNREGSFKTKVGQQSSGSSVIHIGINNVMVRKSDNKIIDGSATVSVSGTISGRGSYSFDAFVTFHSDGTATIAVDGDMYVMVLATGQVTLQNNNQ